MNGKPTPGPWEYVAALTASENHKGFIVSAPTHQPSSHRIRVADVIPMDVDGIEGEANARLIASALDLLAEGDNLYALLSQVYKDMSRLTTYGEWHHSTALALERWEATHVKATGEAIS